MIPQLDRTGPRLPSSVRDVIDAVLVDSRQVSSRFFGNPRLGQVYRAYLISQILDAPSPAANPKGWPPRSRAAEIFSLYRLVGAGSENWVQLYEHINGVVAAAVTIARRMQLSTEKTELVRSAALLHDAAKRQDVEKHGTLANGLENTDHSLATVMRQAGYSDETITAAMNTGREDREFQSDEARQQSIEDKGVVAAIVGLADTRCLGGQFVSLDEALAGYLDRKRDWESQNFFVCYWRPYYEAAEAFLAIQAPALDLRITDEKIYNETVFPEVFGTDASISVRQRYSFR